MIAEPSSKPAIGLFDCTQFIMYPYPHEIVYRLYEDYFKDSHEIALDEFNKWKLVYESLKKDLDELSNHCERVLKEQGFK